MKLLFCEICGDIVSPLPTARQLRHCRCARHAVWWENPNTGVLRVFDRQRNAEPPQLPGLPPLIALSPWEPRAYVLGLHNGFLAYPAPHDRVSVRELIDGTPATYIFRTIESLVIRIRPGESNDTAYAEELPV